MTARMRVAVDRRLCEAHALCVEIAPDVFDLDPDLEDGVATCAEAPGEAARPRVQAAVAACPRQAISLVEEVEEGVSA